MDCGYFEKLIYRLPDGDLSDREQAELHSHLDSCDDCRALQDAVMAAHEAMAELESVPEGFGERVMDAVHEAKKAQEAQEEKIRRNARIRQRWRFGDLGIAAACLALVVVSLNVLFGDLGSHKSADMAMAESAAAPMALEEMTEEAVEEAAAESTEDVAGTGAMENAAAEVTALDGALDAASGARDTADAPVSATADVYDAEGQYLASLDEYALEALLSEADAPAAEANGAAEWVLHYDGAEYELFAVDGDLYWRETGEMPTLSAMGAEDFLAMIE